MKIKDLNTIKQLSSMGNETIKLTLTLENDIESSITLPAGISAGKYEAKNIPALEAIAQINSIKNTLLSADWEQKTLDKKLIELNLAGNTSLAISASFWKAINIVMGKPNFQKFPKLLLLLFEGGKHGNPNIKFQEFLLIEESLEKAVEDFRKMRQYLTEQKIEITVGAEGGFSPMNFTNQLVLDVINEVFPFRQLGIDAAGSFRGDDDDFEKILSQFNIFYLEDPYSDENWTDWVKILEKHGQERLIVGDDLTTTNPERIKKAVAEKSINAVIIKPNQNGTISGTLDAVQVARESGLKIVVSHRGEETDDSWIVYFALIIQADYVKFGGMNRGERIAKYNRLLEMGMH
jgi:enolase